MLIRRTGEKTRFRHGSIITAAGPGRETVDRRQFLAASGLAVGGAAAVAALSPAMIRPAQAQEKSQPQGEVVVKKTVCPFCSVGCSIWAEVQNGVWIGQEPVFESPINMGTHCAKGAATRELGLGERRLKYPVKLVGGRWQRLSWDQAINEIGDKLLEIREKAGPDAVYWLGSAKFSNEQAYLMRKFAALWGTNNVDHQARICHSTTVSGVANTYGYGAMTNSFNDIQNSKSIFLIGSNPAEAHPVSMLHILKSKEQGAKLIVVDPRFTRTAAHAHEYVRVRPGTDIPLMWGLLWHIFENGWEDRDFIAQRVYGMEAVREEVKNWHPEEVERVTGVSAEQAYRVARTLAENRPGTLIWCMGLTQHHIGSSNTRCAAILSLALGNLGRAGGGSNIFRGHDNVQGATDFGLDCTTLPGYYGLSEAAWKHWGRVWDLDYDYLKSRFRSLEAMEQTGIPVSRWFDGVLEKPENIEQPEPIRAMVYWGHAANSQTRLPDLKRGLEKVDLVVVIDPVASLTAALSDRKDGMYLLPSGTTMECAGSVTNSQRALQWREKVVEPVFEAKSDYAITWLLAQKLGFGEQLFRNIRVENGEPSAEDLTHEWNSGMWTVGYTGQSPERLKRHMQHQDKFDTRTTLGMEAPVKGEYYGLPWPCWGTPEFGHPGTPLLYDTSKPVAEGGLPFRARWGVEHRGVRMLAEGSYTRDSEIEDGYPEFTYGMLRKLGWDGDLQPEELKVIREVGGDKLDGVSWKTDTSGGIQRVAIRHGCAPYGNGKARAVVWNFPDPVPVHREPIYTPRRDLVARYPTYEDRRDYRLPVLFNSIQKRDFAAEFPLILTSGRLVEYEGGGDETRTNKWLAELQQQMFAEVNPHDAERLGIKADQMIWLHSPTGARLRVAALITPRVGRGVVFMPFHFGGHWMGEDRGDRYPEGARPYVLGESANTAWTYGYDVVTFMQETKATLCRIERA